MTQINQQKWSRLQEMLCSNDFETVQQAMFILDTLLEDNVQLEQEDGSFKDIFDCFEELAVTSNYWADVSCPTWMKKAPHKYFITIYFLGLRAKKGDIKPLEIDQIVCSEEPFLYLPDAIKYLTGLKKIEVERNKAGFLLTEDVLSMLPNLERVSLFDTKMQDQMIPEWFGKIHSLTSCSFRYTFIKGLPNSIGNLKKLHALDLSYTNLTRLPDSIGELTQLKTLNLEYSERFKHLPQSFSNCTSLEDIYLRDTKIRELPNLSNLKNLRTLRLAYTDIEVFPSYLTTLPKLDTKDIDLYGMKKLQKIEDGFQRLKISDTKVWKNIKQDVFSQSQLEYLDIESNITKDFENLTTLIYLDCRAGDGLPVEIANLTNLKTLKINYVQNLSSLKVLSQMQQLTTLEINVKLEKEEKIQLPNELFELKNLTHFKLSSNVDYSDDRRKSREEIAVPLPYGWNKYEIVNPDTDRTSVHWTTKIELPIPWENKLEEKRLEYLISQIPNDPQVLTIKNLKIQYAHRIPVGLKNLTGLVDLSLTDTQHVPDEIDAFPNLNKIYFSRIKTKEVPTFMRKFFHQFHLEDGEIVWDCKFNLYQDELKPSLHQRMFEAICDVGQVVEGGPIKKLVLSDQGLSQIPDNIDNLVDLEELHINKNPISSLPASMKNLKKLRVINISNTNITEIPSFFPVLSIDYKRRDWFLQNAHTFTNLRKLHFKLALLKSIPQEMKDIETLEHLDLSRNMIKQLGPDIEYIEGIQILDLSWNPISSISPDTKPVASVKEVYLSSKQENMSAQISEIFPNANITVR